MPHDPGLVMIDRDGVINEDSGEFIKSVEEWRPIRRQPRSDRGVAPRRAGASPSSRISPA